MLLTERAGQVVTREEIQRHVWQDSTFVDFEGGINFSINQIRAALGDNADSPRYVETLPRRGYRFIAPITTDEPDGKVANSTPVNGRSHPVAAAEAVMASPETATITSSGRQNVISWWNRKRLGVILTAAAMLIAGGILNRWVFPRRGVSLEKMQLIRLTDSGTAGTVAISPDGRYVVYALRDRPESGLWLRQVGTRNDVRILAPDAVRFVGLTFSPDGNYIYLVRSERSDPGLKHLYSMQMLGGPLRLLVKDVDSPVSFSPDRHRFVFTRGIPTRNEIEVRIANADGSGERLLATLNEVFAGYTPGGTWSLDGRTIAVPSRRYGKQPGYILQAVSVQDSRVRDLYASPLKIGCALWLPMQDSLLVALGDPGQLWTISYPNGRAKRLTNDLADYDGSSMDLTADGSTLAVVEGARLSNLWSMAGLEPNHLQQITSGGLPIVAVNEIASGRLLARSLDGDLWFVNQERGQRNLFRDGRYYGGLNFCGGVAVVLTFDGGTQSLFRIEADGTHPIKLASGDLSFATCSPPDRFVYYVQMGTPQKILRVSLEGGAAKEIAQIPGDGIVGPVSASPDGTQLAYPYEQYTPAPTVKFAIVASDGGTPVNSLPAPAGVYGLGTLRWSPTGKALQYTLNRNGATNIWEQSLDGLDSKQITGFTSGRIFDFSWSQDGGRLFLARGDVRRDVILLTHLQ